MRIETKIKLNKFQARNYQISLFDAVENKKYSRVLLVWPRRAGKDLAAFNLAIRAALRKPQVIFYIFPTYSQGRKVLFDSITNTGERIIHDYIPKELVESINSQEMKIRFLNGSLIQVVGSDSYDSLMGTNPQLCIFSEYALQDPRAYQYIRPILTANGGTAVFLSCVAPNTLVITKNGPQRIKDVSDSRMTYSDLKKDIWGLGGFHNAEQFYYGGLQKTFKITLESGFSIECTPIHPLWNGQEWIKAQDLKLGDLLPIQYGQDVWGSGLDISGFKPQKHKARIFRFDYTLLDDDFFYLLGLLHADGNYNKNTVCLTKKKDKEIIEFLKSYGFITRRDGIHHELSSREFCEFLEFLGFKHGARNKTFPQKLLTLTKSQMRAFIQGVFDGDGTSNSIPSKRGYIKLTSTNISFIQDIQVILLNFGIVGSIRKEEKAPTIKVKVWSTIYNLEITGYFAHIFYRDIGFRLQRKQKNWDYVPASCTEESGNIYPVNLEEIELPSGLITNRNRVTRRTLKKLHEMRPLLGIDAILKENFFYSPIKEIIDNENEVFDFVVPDTHSFFSNGFLSHNTPRGKNHFYQLYQIASNNPEWFCQKLSVLDTGHIPLEEIEKEIRSGEISQDLAQQEYYCSFEMGVEGAFYSKYLDRMRLNAQIGTVAWEPAFKVHSAWDIGVRDSTSIIFFQTVGQTIRIIDFYEKSKEGLEHYIKVLETKPYSYGKHIAPHDIAVTEWGTGMTRLEKARQLGIKFTTTPDLSIIDGIEAVRSTLSKVWIDEKNCAQLIKALENYRAEYDSKRNVYKSSPLHDQYSHAADAMRYLCISLPKTRDSLSAEELDKRYYEAVYGDNTHMPAVFRDDI